MEKRLRSSIQSSAEEFLSSAVQSTLKTSKPTLRTLIHAVKPSSDLSASLPLALHGSISHHLISFRKLLENSFSSPSPSPATSPPTKRRRRGVGIGNESEKKGTDAADNRVKQKQVLDALQILSFIASLCISHPKKAFSTLDLLLAVQALHDNLMLFESYPVFSNEISFLCERWWKEGLEGKETLISQFLPFLLSKSLTFKKKVDVHRVYVLREAFALFDFEDESIEDLRMLLMRCVVSPLYVKTEDGRRFVAYAFGLSRQLMKEALAVVKAQIPFGRKSVLEGYGEILFRAWREAEGESKGEIEDGFLQGLVDAAIYARSSALAASVRRVLGGFINQRTTDGVEKLLFRLAEPVIFRSLQVANSNVRLNTLHLLLDLFPLEDPDATKEAKDTLLDKQFYLLEKLLMDDCPEVRVVAVEGCCRVLHLFWEVIPSSTITKIIAKIFDDMSHDWCNDVRLSTVNGIIYLLGNPQSHEILKVLLMRLGHLMLDNVTSVRVALVDLLLLLKDIRNFQFNKVVSLEVLLATLATDQTQVAETIAKLLMPSYFPSRVNIEEACNRCVTLLKRNPKAGARFCQFTVSLGASLKSVLQLVRVLVNLVFSQDSQDVNQIEGFLLAVACLCKDLASDSNFQDTLKELFPGEKLRALLTSAPSPQAQSSVFDIVSLISPDNVSAILEDCMRLVASCPGLPGDVGLQAELRSVHKLLLSCNAFSDLLEVFTRLLQKTAYRCHINFGCEIEKQSISSVKGRKSKSSGKFSAKWKHDRRKRASSFEEDYSIAVGVSWQIKDLLTSEAARKALLGSEIQELFLALKVISEASIVHSSHCGFMDVNPVLAYTSLALHMTLQNVNSTDGSGNMDSDTTSSRISETLLDQPMDQILGCMDKLFQANDCRTSDRLCSDSKHGKSAAATRRSQRHREPQTSTSKPNDDGSLNGKQRRISNQVKILTAVLKFITDSTEMGFASHLHARCLNFTSKYVKYIISTFGHHSAEKLQFEEADMKDIILCLKSSVSYTGKFLSLALRDITEASTRSFEAFDLANNLLNMFITIEFSSGSVYASRFVAASGPWLPDLILALGSCCIHEQTEVESSYLTALDHIKTHFPSWAIILANIELDEMRDEHPEDEDDKLSEQVQLPVFKKLMGSAVSLLKGNSKIQDAIGLIFLIGSAVGLERKDFDLVSGLVHFLCVKLVGKEDREWKGLDMMLASLPSIYPFIEREINEQNDGDGRRKLVAARDLLEPVWMYHVYETERFSMTEEEE